MFHVLPAERYARLSSIADPMQCKAEHHLLRKDHERHCIGSLHMAHTTTSNYHDYNIHHWELFPLRIYGKFLDRFSMIMRNIRTSFFHIEGHGYPSITVNRSNRLESLAFRDIFSIIYVEIS